MILQIISYHYLVAPNYIYRSINSIEEEFAILNIIQKYDKHAHVFHIDGDKRIYKGAVWQRLNELKNLIKQ